MRDLADFDRPVSDFLSLSGDVWPPSEDAVMKYRFSESEMAQYEKEGFLDGVAILNEAQVARLREDLALLMDPTHAYHSLWHEYNENEAGEESNMVLFHSLGAWRISEAFHDLLFHPGIAVRTAQLLGCDAVRLWHDQIFSKPPKNGAVVAWHQG